MWRDLRSHWRDAAFWRWWWRESVGRDSKVAVVACLAGAVALAGYLSANALSSRASAPAADTTGVVTVWDEAPPRTVAHTRVVWRLRTVRTPVTVTDHTTAPARTIVQTVTSPGAVRAVPGPVRTVVRTVAAPARTVTVQQTLPAQTVMSVVTQVASVTVTETQTSPPVTVTVTAPSPGPGPGPKPKPK